MYWWIVGYDNDIYFDGHVSHACCACMGMNSLGGYSVGVRIWDVATHLLVWGPTVGGLQWRAEDLGSGSVLTCMGACSSASYSPGLRILQLSVYSHACKMI